MATWHAGAAAAVRCASAATAAAVHRAVGDVHWEVRGRHQTLDDFHDKLDYAEQRCTHRTAILIRGDDLDDHLQDTENRFGRCHREKRWAEEASKGSVMSQGLSQMAIL